MKVHPKAGDVFRVVYPMVREEYEAIEEDGPVKRMSWRPGVSIETCDHGWVDMWCESEGEMRLTVVDCHKPGRFPTRVFYTRCFIDPDGNEFGKNRLQICTLEKFRRISKEYGPAYDAEEAFEEAAERRAAKHAFAPRANEAAGQQKKCGRANEAERGT